MSRCKFQECSDAVFCRGYCKRHYARARRSGELQLNPLRAHGTVEERFWRRVEKTSGCWIWRGGVHSGGYGFMRGEGGRNAPNVTVHRLSYEMHHGPIPDGLVVMHACDNPLCVNPDHLSVGTHKDNTQDMIAKGRAANNKLPVSVGADNGRALLTESKVRYIRASTASHASLARRFGVSATCIASVRNRQTWSHVE